MWLTNLTDYLKALSPFGTAAATYGFFRVLDKDASRNAKAAVSAWIKSAEYRSEDLRDAVVRAFDRIYSTPLLHPKALMRSILISLASVFITLLFLSDMNIYAPLYAIFLTFVGPGYVYGILLPSVVVSDYISLFVIRRWLRATGHNLFVGLIGATFIGILIVLSSLTLWSFTEGLIVGLNLRQAWILVEEHRFEMVHGQAILAALIVYAWLLLFALGAFVLRILDMLLRALRLAQWFHGAGHPLRAIGYVAAAVVFIAVAISQNAVSVFRAVSE